MGEKQELLRKIPKIDEVLQDERLIFFMEKTPRSVVVEAVRQQINELRNGHFGQGSDEVGTTGTLNGNCGPRFKAD